MDIADWSTVLTGAIAVAAFLGSFPAIGRIVLEIRMWLAKASLARQVQRIAGRDGRRARALRASWAQARALASGVTYTAADELQWLTTAVGEDHCVTYSAERRGESAVLAGCYRRYAAALRLRGLLFGSGQPLTDRVADVADQVAGILDLNADHRTVESAGRVDVARQRVATGYVSRRSGTERELGSVLLVEQLEIDDRFTDHHVHVSWLQEHSRSPRPWTTTAEQPREYDGLLPRLIHHRYERDLSSGNYRLHLHLGEIYYTDHKRHSTPGAGGADDGSETHGGLLTVSLLPVTRDGHLVLVQRGGLSYYPKCWGPGAGGNLEIARPGRANPDAGPNGIIDPLRAIARETHEEIGVPLLTERIRSLGLARLSNSEEDGTWLLATTAAMDVSLTGVLDATRKADPINGRWEVGDRLALVPVPRSPAAAESLLSWALHNERVMPHLAACLLMLLASEFRLDPGELPRRASDDGELPPGAREYEFGQQRHGSSTQVPDEPRPSVEQELSHDR